MRFSRYQLIEQINNGDRGELWLAEQLGANGFCRKVVIARLGADASANPAAVEAFINATKSAAMIDHAHVARVFDIGCEDGQFYYSRTWVDGMSVHQLLAELATRDHSVPLEHALFIARRVADAINAAHRAEARDGTVAPVVHGALSASRVLVSRYGEVVVTGFTGEAIFDDRGGPAPDPIVDARSDVYAIGALLFELIAGVPAIASDERPLLAAIDPKVPARLDRMVTRALAEDPAQRYPDVESLLIDLRAIAGVLESSSAYALGTWMSGALEDPRVRQPSPKKRHGVAKFPPIPPTQVRPLAEIGAPTRMARGSGAAPVALPSAVPAIAVTGTTESATMLSARYEPTVQAPNLEPPARMPDASTDKIWNMSSPAPDPAAVVSLEPRERSSSYANMPVVTRPRRASRPRSSRKGRQLKQLLILLAIATLLFAASTTITMAVH